MTVFYTAPTAIRAFMKWGDEWPARRARPVAPAPAGHGRASRSTPRPGPGITSTSAAGVVPIVDTWWQTETGQILITPLAGCHRDQAGLGHAAVSGHPAEILTEGGELGPVGGGYLAITSPWPARMLGIWGDEERFIQTYWSKWDRNTYFPGDGAKRDDDGYFWIMGRVDDVINVAGHRLGTMEVESALVDHPAVAEAAVIGVPHEIKGTAVVAFVTLREGSDHGPGLVDELKQHVVKKIGAIARPEDVLFTADLPKTRSGKIMRRLLRDIAEGKALGDTTTLADPAVVQALKEKYEERRKGSSVSVLRAQRFLQRLARLEGRSPRGRDLQRRARVRVSPDSGLARTRLEGAEAGDRHLVAPHQGRGDQAHRSDRGRKWHRPGLRASRSGIPARWASLSTSSALFMSNLLGPRRVERRSNKCPASGSRYRSPITMPLACPSAPSGPRRSGRCCPRDPPGSGRIPACRRNHR